MKGSRDRRHSCVREALGLVNDVGPESAESKAGAGRPREAAM